LQYKISYFKLTLSDCNDLKHSTIFHLSGQRFEDYSKMDIV
jgi:hypothetical protein